MRECSGCRAIRQLYRGKKEKREHRGLIERVPGDAGRLPEIGVANHELEQQRAYKAAHGAQRDEDWQLEPP